MKEQLYTIPLNDAVNAHDECPFCFVEREVEQNQLDFVLGSGSSYMVSDIREQTDKAGFCKMHYRKMFLYGNTLGNAWMLKTHLMSMRSEMEKTLNSYTPGKTTLKSRFSKSEEISNPINAWIKGKEESCFICNAFKEAYARYLDTFFVLWKKDPEFVQKIKDSKGFCLSHYGDLCEEADKKLNDKQKAEFYDITKPLMIENMARIQEDVNWLIEKFDYKHTNDPWKESKDANQRAMQKLKGGYPADPNYEYKK